MAFIRKRHQRKDGNRWKRISQKEYKGGKGYRVRYQIVWIDALEGHSRRGRRTASCHHGRHEDAFRAAGVDARQVAVLADGCRNKKQRELLLSYYEELEAQRRRQAVERAERRRTGGEPRYDTPIAAMVKQYLDGIREAVRVREEALANGGDRRAGKSPKTLEHYEDALHKWTGWLHRKHRDIVTAGQLDVEHLTGFVQYLESRYISPHTGRALAPASVNHNIRALKAFFSHYFEGEGRRPFFRLPERETKRALKLKPTGGNVPEKFKPEELQRFLAAAVELDTADRVLVEREKNGRVEMYEQTAPRTPILRWVLVLMLTGCRRHEAAGLQWPDVDLETGIITFCSVKTGAARETPLLGTGRRKVSPHLLELLRRWKLMDGGTGFVMPENGKDGTPTFPRGAWRRLRKMSVDIKPKALRSNWVSYAAAVGFPLSSVARWAGHSPIICEKHYHAAVAVEADSLDAAMGLEPILDSIMADLGHGGTSEQSA